MRQRLLGMSELVSPAVLVMCKLGWPDWCRDELVESSAGWEINVFVSGAIGAVFVELREAL